MGLKRPFDVEEVQEFNVKHARSLTYDNNLTQLDAIVPYHVSLAKPGALGERLSYLDFEDEIEDETWNENANHVGKDFESSSCEDTGFGVMNQSFLSHESPELDFPWRPISHVEDVYSCSLDCSPKKQVPIGFNYQADIPEFDRPVKEEITFWETRIDEDEERLMGKCIIPARDADIFGIEVCKTGKGRKDCHCWDKGSVRCVRQHIMEAREDLIENIGLESFVKLGFCEMGEEIANKWNEEEQDHFHEVVYANPVSLGRNFWNHLKVAFSSLTIKELVSYYFNVFILQRRAVQNRVETLDIDSDDDELQVDYDTFYRSQSTSDEEDCSIGSPFRQQKSVSDDDDDDDDDDDGDNGNQDGNPSDNATKEAAIRHVYMDKVTSKDGIETVVEDDSFMSLEFQSGVVYTRSPMGNKEKSDMSKCWRQRFDGCGGDLINHLYSFDACDSRLPNPWTKNIDFLPTSNIIEEIFGQDAWENDSHGSK